MELLSGEREFGYPILYGLHVVVDWKWCITGLQLNNLIGWSFQWIRKGNMVILHFFINHVFYIIIFTTHTLFSWEFFSSTFQIFCGNKIVEVVLESNHLYINNSLTLSAGLEVRMANFLFCTNQLPLDSFKDFLALLSLEVPCFISLFCPAVSKHFS